MKDDDTDAGPATVAASGGDDTAAAPTEHATELIETAAAPTPELAWSATTDEQETETLSEKRGRALWLVPVMALLAAAIAVASALLFYIHRTPAPNAPVPSPSSGNARPAPPVFDGTYRLDYQAAKHTQNGAPDPQPNTNNATFWAFRSSCRSTECVATGTGLDANNHQLARTPAVTSDFHFVDGRWQGTLTRQVPRPRCLAANEEVIAGTDTGLIALSFEPQAGGTLRGVQTITVLTNECGLQGAVLQTPLVVTRIGDVPPGVTVADPATVAAPTTSTPVLFAGGPALEGTYRVDYDNGNQTINGAPTTGTIPRETEWWAFRSLCASTGCVASGSKLSDTNHGDAVGVPAVLRFVDARWQDTPYLQPPTPCPGTDGSVTKNETHSWSLEPQPDGTLRGVETITALTGDCRNQGTVWRAPMELTRVSDVSPTVTLADPALFAAPTAAAAKGPH